MKILLLVLGLLCIRRASCQNGTEIGKTFELLEEGSKRFELNTEIDAVLVLGATGSGKSTLIQWMAGDNTNLDSVETSPGSDKYLIEDKNDKIGSSSISKTLYPELVMDMESETTFYDLPGFSDTRNPSYEIAASFFMKSVMDHVLNVKMLFLTSYFSVQEGMDRTGFRSLLKNIDELIADLDKFRNSIALVVTKVDNNYSKHGKSFVLKPDRKVIEEIATFLQKIRKDFKEELQNPDISDKQRRFSMNAMKIIDIFLTEENGELTRISLFRRPDEQGLLSEIEQLKDEKVLLERMISQNLLFTQTDQNDFGFTISDKSKLEIGDLAIQINDQITADISEIAANIKDHLLSFVEPVRSKIVAGDLEALNLPDCLAFTAQANRSVSVLSDAVHYFTSLRVNAGMGGTIRNYLSQLGVEVPESMEENFEKFSKYFEFFQLFHETSLPSSSLAWANSFQTSLSYLTESKQFISDKASSLSEEMNSEITSNVDSVVDAIKADFTADINRMAEKIVLLRENSSAVKVNRLEAEAFYAKIRTGETSMTKLAQNVKEMLTPLMLHNEISETLDLLKLRLFDDILSNIQNKSREFNILQKLSDTNLSFQSAQCSNSFKTIVTFLQTQNIWTHVKYSEEKIALDVDSLLKTVFDKILSIVDKKAFRIGFEEIDEELNKFHFRYASISDNLKTETTLKKLTTEIAASSSMFNDSETSFRDDLITLTKQENDLGFLKSLRGDETDVIATPAWEAHITVFKGYLDRVLNFNDFVMGLYEALSKFEVQKDISRYNVQDLSNWGQQGRPQGMIVDKINFKLFMKNIKQFNIKETDQVDSIVPSDSQLSILNDALTATLKNRVVTQCPSAANSTVTVKANFIKFSDFLDADGKLKGCGWDNVAALEIYALAALFIDQDLNALGARLKISVTAPSWEVIGNRKIVLDGKDGEAFSKAANGIYPGGDGQNGLLGREGGSAGSFFGIASTFVGSENLTISANGGKGGPGQSGGDGANGKDGKTPPERQTCSSSSYKNCGFEVEVEYDSSFEMRIRGRNATKGGNAGPCGVGGRGGLKGKVTAIGLSKTSETVIIADDGQSGEYGHPGKAGLGGRHGDDRIVVCEILAKNQKTSYEFWYSYLLTLESGYASDGTSIDYCIVKFPKNPQDPLPPKTVQDSDFSIKKFKNFYVENSIKRFVGLAARRTYDQFNVNSKIRNLLHPI